MTKNQKILTGLFALILVLFVIGVTYAYFTATVTNNSTAVSVTTTQLANLEMTSLKSETGTPVYPGWMGWQGIDVHATGSGSVVYDLTLNISGDTAVKSDVQIDVCKIENTQEALAANQVTYTAATAQVNTSVTPVQYYMSGGVVTLPSGCTSVLSGATLTSLGTSKVISEAGGKELTPGNRDRYYIKITYVNDTSAAQTQGQAFTITPSISTKAVQIPPVVFCETTPDSGTYGECNPANMTIGQRVKIAKSGQPDQYFRYVRTTDNGVTSLNECADGAESSACNDTNANGKVGIPGAGYIRLLAEYNLNVGGNQYKVNNVVVNDGIQDEHVFGYKNGYTTYGNIAFGPSNSSYAASNVKTYVENYASILNTRYGINVTGSVMTKAEIMNLCGLSGSGTCANTYSWVYNTSYWSGSAGKADNVWFVYSDAIFSNYGCSNTDHLGARAVIQISASSI